MWSLLNCGSVCALCLRQGMKFKETIDIVFVYKAGLPISLLVSLFHSSV